MCEGEKLVFSRRWGNSLQLGRFFLAWLGLGLMTITITACSSNEVEPISSQQFSSRLSSRQTPTSQPKNESHPQNDSQPKQSPQEAKIMEKATFGAGCFWGVEATFRKIKGVTATAVGFSGGTLDQPTYKDVCTDKTGHAEVVEIEFDPTLVSYEELLDVFWKHHDPTTLNRQGPDVGTQYRSVIFYHSPEQKAAALASKQALETSHQYKKPIVTQILPASPFWRAEEYHQQYLEKRGLSSCTTH
jgi:peptide-methionine (S)-S-oxide reductase